MVFNANGKSSTADLSRFESEIGFSLPEDYGTFLRVYNGGSFCGSYPEITAEVIANVQCDCLFGLNMPKAADVSFWQKEFREDIPAKSLLIGKDSVGGFLLLCCDSANPACIITTTGTAFQVLLTIGIRTLCVRVLAS
jgi:hypothetical protein